MNLASATVLGHETLLTVKFLLSETESISNSQVYSCHDNIKNFVPASCENNVEHCKIVEGKDFCFNGKIIIDEKKSSNKTMYDFLCQDTEYPPVDLSFGPCLEDDPALNDGLIVEGKIYCYCLSKQWKCTNTEPTKIDF